MPAKSPSQHVWIPCSECGGRARNHSIEQQVRDRWPDYDISGSTYYEMCRCGGCGTVRFRRYNLSEESGRDPDGYPILDQEVIYPPVAQPTGQHLDVTRLPDKVASIHQETIQALQAGTVILAGAGLRAIVEAVCLDRGITGKNLEAKIDALANAQLLTAGQAKFLHEARFIGNAALHEIEPPTAQELKLGLQVVEGLLSTIYILPAVAGQLKQIRDGKKV